MVESIWKEKPDEKIEAQLKEIRRLKDKERHARYYQRNRKKILAKQKKRDELRDRKTYSKTKYLAHRSEFLEKNKLSYQKNKEARKTASKRYYWQHREEILKKRKEKRLKEKKA